MIVHRCVYSSCTYLLCDSAEVRCDVHCRISTSYDDTDLVFEASSVLVLFRVHNPSLESALVRPPFFAAVREIGHTIVAYSNGNAFKIFFDVIAI